jgi:hypothetical protein
LRGDGVGQSAQPLLAPRNQYKLMAVPRKFFR